MPHIHTGPGQIDHTVTMYLFDVRGSEPTCLVHKHKKFGKLMPIGGHVEVDETAWGAVAHELIEEAGYELSDVDVLQPTRRLTVFPGAILHPQPVCLNTHDITPDHFHSDTAYAMVVRGEPTHALAPGESDDIRWLTRKQVEVLSDEETFRNSKQVYLYVFDELLDSWERVPANEYSTEKPV